MSTTAFHKYVHHNDESLQRSWTYKYTPNLLMQKLTWIAQSSINAVVYASAVNHNIWSADMLDL